MMVTQRVAQLYIQDTAGQKLSFDVWLSKQRLRVFQTNLAVFTQTSMRVNSPGMVGIAGKFEYWQDALCFLWAIVLLGAIFAPISIFVTLALRYGVQSHKSLPSY
jgi:hypothetical protein